MTGRPSATSSGPTAPLTAYRDLTRAEAAQDAAVGCARDQGLPLRYAVVRIAAEEVF